MVALNGFFAAFEKAAADKQVATVALITPDGKMLMGKRRDNRRWTNPGGHLEKGESPRAGAAREVKEETGIAVDAAKLIRMQGKTVRTPEGDQLKIHPYRMAVGDELKATSAEDPDNECSEWRWVPLAKLPTPLHVPLERNVLLQNLGIEKAARREIGRVVRRVLQEGAQEAAKRRARGREKQAGAAAPGALMRSNDAFHYVLMRRLGQTPQSDAKDAAARRLGWDI